MIEMLQSLNPATGEVVWQGPVADAAGAADAVARARAAGPGWARLPVEHRIAMARAYAGVLEARREDLALLIARETGKLLWEARTEVAAMIGKVDISIRAQAERTGVSAGAQPYGRAVFRHQPHGVMAVLGPYNFPGHLPNGHIVPALLAGNTVVFKPSELTPGVGAAMVDAWHAAGLPGDVLQVLQGGRDTGAALIEQDIDGLLFTGSATAGRHFRRAFVDRPGVILALELGGNNPLVVWDDATDPAVVSDHLCWTGVGGFNSHDLLPVPLTDEALDTVCRTIDRAQSHLGRRMLFENPSSYIAFPGTITEWDFLGEMVRRTGCGLLLDVNNVFVSAMNHAIDPFAWLDGLPLHAVGQIHLAGHSQGAHGLIDTHDAPVDPAVWALYAKVIGRTGPVPTMIERDGNIPDLGELLAELATARAVVAEPVA